MHRIIKNNIDQSGMLILLNPFCLFSVFYLFNSPEISSLDFKQKAVCSICCFHNATTSFPLNINVKRQQSMTTDARWTDTGFIFLYKRMSRNKSGSAILYLFLRKCFSYLLSLYYKGCTVLFGRELWLNLLTQGS